MTAAVVRLDALRNNLECIRSAAPGARVLAVVKANGYGHGLAHVAGALAADAFAVACLAEARTLREAGIDVPVVLLEGAADAVELEQAAALDCELVVHGPWQLDLLAAATPADPFPVWLKVDTGMNRLGFRLEDAHAAWERLRELAAVGTIRLMTHLARAEESEHPMTAVQVERFFGLTRGWPVERSVANSAGIFAWPGTHGDWVRPGLSLYGVSPFPDRDGAALGLQPAMTLAARLISVRNVAAGETVGYGGTWTAAQATRVGVVDIGYGDGFPHHAGPDATVLVNGEACRLAGRVSMDMLAVELGQVDAAVGDPVVLWGDGLPVERVAAAAGTIPWALLAGLTDRVDIEYR